jgi:thiamine transport system substrate-binding protein
MRILFGFLEELGMRKQGLVWLIGLALLVACGANSAAIPTAVPASESTVSTTTTDVATTAPDATATPPASTAGVTEVTVLTHDSFAVSPEVLAKFEIQYQAKVVIINAGDAGSMLNKAILSKDAPLADVIYGVDNTFLSRALESGILADFTPSVVPAFVPEATTDVSAPLLPVDVGYVLINYDVAGLKAAGLPVPQSLQELTEPQWKGKLVIENPATSSTGLAFFLATVAEFGPDGWQAYWQALRANDVLVANDWTTAYYTHFSGSSGKGPRPLVVSYSTSPAAEVFFSEGKLTEPPTGNVAFGAFRQVEYAGVLKGAKQATLAQQFVEFMLSNDFQNDMPTQMFVYPASQTATLPELYTKFAAMPSINTQLDAKTIASNRDAWLTEWDTIVLK